MAKDVIISDSGSPIIKDGDFVMGDSFEQEVTMILRSNKGDWKAHPLLGPNLHEYIRSGESGDRIRSVVALHLKADGKNYNDVKDQIRVKTNGA